LISAKDFTQQLERLNKEMKKFWEKEILNKPETFFTQDVLEQIDVYAQKKFKYGSSITVENEEEETEE
jgi:hypothetical protein